MPKLDMRGEAPTVWLTTDVLLDIKEITAQAKGEVTWLGRVTNFDSDSSFGDFLVDAIYLPKQEVGDAHADIEPVDLANLAKEVGDDLEDEPKLRLWGHSHGKMRVFASNTDEKGLESIKGWSIQQITNKDGEFLHRLWLPDMRLVVDELPWKLWDTDQTREERWKKEIEAKVTTKVVVAQHGFGFINGNWGPHSDADKPNGITVPYSGRKEWVQQKDGSLVETTKGRKSQEIVQYERWEDGTLAAIEPRSLEAETINYTSERGRENEPGWRTRVWGHKRGGRRGHR